MGRRALRASEAKHRADRDFIMRVRSATIEQLAFMQLRYVHARLWKRAAIQQAITRHWRSKLLPP